MSCEVTEALEPGCGVSGAGSRCGHGQFPSHLESHLQGRALYRVTLHTDEEVAICICREALRNRQRASKLWMETYVAIGPEAEKFPYGTHSSVWRQCLSWGSGMCADGAKSLFFSTTLKIVPSKEGDKMIPGCLPAVHRTGKYHRFPSVHILRTLSLRI